MLDQIDTLPGFSKPPAERRDFACKLARLAEGRGDHPIILVNSTPKSASTFTTELARQAIGGVVAFGGELSVELEQNFTIEGLARTAAHPVPLVYKQHCLANALNLAAIQALDMRVVNLTRDFFDSMVSIDDHLRRVTNPRGVALWPGLRVRGYAEWEEDDRFEFIASYIMPWYFCYLAGWQAAAPSSLFFYEDLVTAPDAFATRLASHLDLPPRLVRARIRRPRGKFRFNVGRVGRGAHLRGRYLDRFRRLAGFFPQADFTRVGICDASDAVSPLSYRLTSP